MITIHANTTTWTIEEHLTSITKSVDNVLRLATNFPRHSLGLNASIIQLLVTWINGNKPSVFRAFISSVENADTQLQNICGNVVGLVAILLADKVITDGGADITERAKKTAASRYKQLSTIETTSQNLLLLVDDCHPFTPDSAPFVRLTWHDRQTRRALFLNDFLFHLREAMGRFGMDALPQKQLDSLGALIYELFSNTEEWATTDLNNLALAKSVRGIVVDVVPLKVAAQEAPTTSAFRHYLDDLSIDLNNFTTHLLEISIFDSGVGLASRELKKKIGHDMDVGEEYEAFRRCLQRNRTSSLIPGRGLGLFFVMRLLTDLKGFLQIRSGRLSLFRDFLAHPMIITEKLATKKSGIASFSGYEYLWDTAYNPSKNIIEASQVKKNLYSHVAGTVFTVWIPIGTVQQNLLLFKPE